MREENLSRAVTHHALIGVGVALVRVAVTAARHALPEVQT